MMLLLALAAVPVDAREISKIEFRSRIPANILLTQSALTENRSYSDTELELAVARLRRLPFVYSASYSVDGTTLVIDVADQFRVFFFLDSFLQGNRNIGGNGFINTDVGGRYYLPWGGMIRGSVGLISDTNLNGSSWNIDYSQYGILGTRLFAIVGLSASTASEGTNPRVMVGYPLTLRQTLTARAERSRFANTETFSAGLSQFLTSGNRSNSAIGWMSDTRNDPLFATRGLSITAELGFTRQTDFAESRSSGRIIFSNEIRTRTSDTFVAAQKFWPIGRGAFSVTADTILNRGTRDFKLTPTSPFVRRDADTQLSNASINYAYNFFDSVATKAGARHRAEVAIGIAAYQDRTARSESKNFEFASLGYALKNRGVTVHFVASYRGD
jgi:hypothetical protein